MNNGRSRQFFGTVLGSIILLLLVGCASQIHQVTVADTEQVTAPPPPSYSGLKHRVAIAKFEDKSGYGSNLFGNIEDLGGKASAILASHLVKTGEFIVVERENLKAMQDENALQGRKSEFIDVSSLIIGSVTEFGTKTEVRDEGIAKTKVQTAHSKVTVRLVNPSTGIVFYSEFGLADVTNTSSQLLGFGTKTGYDATLTDRALNAAITKLVSNIMSSLRALPWSAPILDVKESQIIIGTGSRGGLKVGDELIVVRPGAKVTNPATNAIVELPGETVGKIAVKSLFGTNDSDEGAICTIISGTGFTKDDRIQQEGKNK